MVFIRPRPPGPPDDLNAYVRMVMSFLLVVLVVAGVAYGIWWLLPNNEPVHRVPYYTNSESCSQRGNEAPVCTTSTGH